MSTPSGNSTRPARRRLADLETETRELERRLSAARATLNRELSQLACEGDPAPGPFSGQDLWDGPGPPAGYATGPVADAMYDPGAAPGEGAGAAAGESDGARGDWAAAAGRTEALVNGGRHDAYRRGFGGWRKFAVGAVAAAVAAVTIAISLRGGSGTWPAGVATVQREVAQACRNPDVKAEPSQVDFACARSTRQILWVFALMTSLDNPRFRDARTGRVGLEPITAADGGKVAWSLNLHHPYNPLNPIDSIQVAARAIDNIIGGASYTGAGGRLVVQSGLEGNSANCARYTGSGAVITQQGFPNLCARPVTVAGRTALVADVFLRWSTGSTPQAAHAAAVLFEHAKDPGNAQVQAILRQVMRSRWVA